MTFHATRSAHRLVKPLRDVWVRSHSRTQTLFGQSSQAEHRQRFRQSADLQFPVRTVVGEAFRREDLPL